jgi:hypothetical protein
LGGLDEGVDTNCCGTLFAFSMLNSAAKADCKYNKSNAYSDCSSAIKDGAQKTIGHQSNLYKDVEKRVDSLGQAVKECLTCTMGKLEGAADSATNTNTDD